MHTVRRNAFTFACDAMHENIIFDLADMQNGGRPNNDEERRQKTAMLRDDVMLCFFFMGTSRSPPTMWRSCFELLLPLPLLVVVFVLIMGGCYGDCLFIFVLPVLQE